MLDPQSTIEILCALAILAPFVASVALGVGSFVARVPSERTARSVVMAGLGVTVVSLALLAVTVVRSGEPFVEVDLGAWFGVGEYRFELGLLLDELSLGYGLTVSIIGLLIARFAIRYLHREEGYTRFFGLLGLTIAGLLVVALAASFDVLFLGWEIVGLCSVTMVLFFHLRPGPVRASLQVLMSYRIADLGLLIGVVLLHQSAGTTRYEAVFEHGAWPAGATHVDALTATAVGLLLLLSAAGKSAQLPFSGWLPRAMEGPTPSSALFYGALSIHAGIFLILRSAPLWAGTPTLKVAAVLLGGTTALYAALVGRVQSDAKGQMAYATMAQLGVMLVEIGFGFVLFAALHLVAHAFLRGFQLLRTPSVIGDVRRIQAELRGRPLPSDNAIERALPLPTARWLYRHALERFQLDVLADRLVISPVRALSRALAAADDAAIHWLEGAPKAAPDLSPPPPSPSIPPPPDPERATIARTEALPRVSRA